MRRWPSRVANVLLRALSGVDIHDFGTTFRAYRAELVKELRLLGDFHRYIPALARRAARADHRDPHPQRGAPGRAEQLRPRAHGRSLLDLVLLSISSLRYMDRPLRAFGQLALLAATVGTTILAALLARWPGRPACPPFASTAGGSSSRSSSSWPHVQILMTGILAEILVRVLFGMGDRRVYAVRRECGSGGAASLMCGLVGLFAHDGDGATPDRWFELVGHLRHRGPDCRRVLGGRAVLPGPSPPGHPGPRHRPPAHGDGGRPPGRDPERRDLQLRRAARRSSRPSAHAFRTDSDTEVLLHGYQRLGPSSFPARLVGQFAFALADRPRRRLFLAGTGSARSRSSSAARRLRRVRVGSEAAGRASRPRPAARRGRARGYLSLNYVPGEATLLAGVRQLPRPPWALFSAERAERVRRYWALPRGRSDGAAPWTKPSRNGVRSSIAAVRLAMRADVPVGILLSGGMDSSLVAESAVRQEPAQPRRAYFLDFEDRQWSEHEAALDRRRSPGPSPRSARP